ncbi:MAG: hypothetical protein O3A87_09765 [Verrucomicrobia bacterium]|nr:hypothetical protein [Verrucomicrobiota bacterium]MDA1006744.1 hypothetical protein [Verrucomicrobiota bacterium]
MMTPRTNPVAALLLALVFCVPGQARSAQTLKEALRVVQDSASVNTGAVGFAAQRTPAFDAFLVIRDTTSREQLLEFTRHPHVNVRAYAGMALQSRFPDDGFFELLMEKLRDEDSFEFFSGCSQSTVKIGDFYHRLFEARLSPEQRLKILDDLLLHENTLETTDSLLRNGSLPASLLPSIRTQASRGNPSALIALAQFNDPSDYPLIVASAEKHPYEVYRCIALNPQPEFSSLLAKAHPALLAEKYHSTTQREFYNAVAAFKTEETLNLLVQVLESDEEAAPMKSYHLEFVYQSIGTHSDPLYDPLKWRFWSELGVVDLPTFSHLRALDEERANTLACHTLEHLDWRIKDDLLTALLDAVRPRDPALVERLIVAELERCDVSRYRFFADIAAAKPQTTYIEPLFIAIESAGNPHLFLEATKALIAYDQAAIHRRILAAPAKNPALASGWGGEAFQELTKTIDASAVDVP